MTLRLATRQRRSRWLRMTAGALLLGLVLVGAGVVTDGAFAPTTLVGVVLVVVGLGSVARVPAVVQRSDLTLMPDGLAWEGIGAPAWSMPWSEVSRVVLHLEGRGRVLVAVEVVVTDPGTGPGDVSLVAPVTDVDARAGLDAALAQYAGGVLVEEALI